jgi:hypothetical protein
VLALPVFTGTLFAGCPNKLIQINKAKKASNCFGLIQHYFLWLQTYIKILDYASKNIRKMSGVLPYAKNSGIPLAVSVIMSIFAAKE